MGLRPAGGKVGDVVLFKHRNEVGEPDRGENLGERIVERHPTLPADAGQLRMLGK